MTATVPNPAASKPTTVLLCFSQSDAPLHRELEKHLAPLIRSGALNFWHAGEVSPGGDVEAETRARLESARIVLALVTADFLNTPQLLALIERARDRGATIVPVLAKRCLWTRSLLGPYSPLPADGKFIAKRRDRDAAWTEVAHDIGVLVGAADAPIQALVGPTREQREARERWLRSFINTATRRRVLAGIGSGLGVDLGEVRVPVRMAIDRQGTQPLPSLLEQITKARPGTRMVIVGDVGTGKSELLYETGARLAERALTDPAAPVPVLLKARDLAADLQEAILKTWRMSREVVRTLLTSRPPLVLLVDGLDEAGPEAPDYIETLADVLGERCYALVVASRPVLRFRDLHADELWLLRWSPIESDQFLDLCSKHLPEAVQRIRAVRPAVPPDLLDHPLMASLCLLVAQRDQTALQGRAAVYRALVRRLVDEWFKKRRIRSAPVAKVMTGLETLALEVVQRQIETISESDLRRVFGRNFAHAESVPIETAGAHLGLLVQRADGRFDFALRSLAEHLAGRALLAQGDAQIVAASGAVWGAEAVRHAVGLASIDDDPSIPAAEHRASLLILAILEREEEDDITSRNHHLRRVLAAIRAATDLDKISTVALGCLQKAIVRRLWNETSVWVGDKVAEAVSDCVRLRPRRFKGILQLALHGIAEPVTRESWFAAQTCKDAGGWIEHLAERDTAVRWIITQQLARFANKAQVRNVLLRALEDDGMTVGMPAVPMGAGVVLRRARRDKNFAKALPSLRHLLEHGDAFHQVGAAIALLPGEADVRKRAAALCRGLGGDGFGVPREVLEEVAADPAGREELERRYPDWRTKNEPRGPEPLPPDWQGLPPPSSEVRQRLVQAIAPALRGAKEEILGKVRSRAGMTLPMVACDLAIDIPELICALLRAAPETPLALHWDPEADQLGRAAVRHESVRNELIGLWKRMQTMAPTDRVTQGKADFPGRALEGLIRTGKDEEAERVFAEWLLCGHHSIPFRTFGSPLLQGFECPPAIRDAGHRVAQNFFAQVGKAMYFGIAEGLFRLSSFWKHDMELRRGVEAWLSAGDYDQLSAGLWASQAIGLTDEARIAFRANMGRVLDPPEVVLMNPGWLRTLPLIHRMGLLNPIRELVELLAEVKEFAVIAVPLTFSWHDAAERRTRSRRVAKNLRLLDFVPDYLTARLVAPAPDIWAKSLEELVVGGTSVADLLPFLRALPVNLQARVVARWAPTADEYPWVRDGLGGRCVRPADKVRQLLFDLGLEEPGPPHPPS